MADDLPAELISTAARINSDTPHTTTAAVICWRGARTPRPLRNPFRRRATGSATQQPADLPEQT